MMHHAIAHEVMTRFKQSRDGSQLQDRSRATYPAA
jgi:hypothetical protein